jgi:type IV pilus assembly protein PilY1
MLRLNHVIRLWYLAFILGWMGYASGLHAAPLQLESVPLSLVLKVEPNLMLLIDDSASMNWEVSTADLVNDGRYTGTQRDGSSPAGAGQVKHRDNNDDGIADCSFGTAPGSPPPAGQSLYGYAYGVEFPTNGDPSPDPRKCNTADDEEWRFRNYNFNPIYFNPNLTYLPWAGVDAAGNPFQNMNIHTAKDNPYAPASPTIDLTRNNSKGDPNITSDRNGDSMPDGFRYYTWTDANGNGLFDDGEETVHFIATKSENEQQNFANWFSYYRKREYAVKARYGAMLATMSSTRVGLVTLHNNANISPFSPNSSVTTINLPLQSIDLDAQAPTQPNTDPARGNKRRSLDALYSFRTQKGTPLRVTLNAIGEYLEDKFGHTLFPNDNAYLTSTNGGACQQSFVILMTDGIDTTTDAVMGNTDAVPSTDENDSAFKPGFNGGPYADIPDNTLADVAMHYYQRDLRPLMDDIVPISLLDQARHQHMVTYTITFDGFNGTLTRDPFPNENGTTFWPQSLADDKARIDDLRHAAFNGRGQFLQANNAGALADALRQALTGIAQRTSSAASVALNAGALTTSTRVFQTRFDSGDWSGQLLSIKLDPTTSAPLPIPNPSDSIDSGALLDQRLSNSNYDTSVRTILTYKPSTDSGIPFTWSDLETAQKAALDRNISGVVDNLGQARLTYLRGSNADEGQGNHFRVRAHRLGDIIDSDPFFVGPPALPEEVDATFTDPSKPYVQFRDDPTNRNRPKMILVGSNDGMLHIFNANNPFDATTGQGDTTPVRSFSPTCPIACSGRPWI